MASDYADDYREPRAPRRDHRAPYPDSGPADYGMMMDDYGADARGRPPPRGAADDPHAADLPPPPLGETLKPALKREGSRNRVSPDTRPQFEDGVSTLGRGPPDLERKNRPRDKEFRDRRDGYESDEGDAHRSSKYTPAGGRPRKDRGAARDNPPRDPPPPYPDSMVSSRRGGDPYDDAPPPRRRRDPDPYDDDYPPPRRRRDDPPVQYGSDPVPARRRSARPPPRRGDRYDEYDDEDDRRPRRRRSHDEMRRRPRDYYEDDYYSDEPRRRRGDDDYDRPRRRDRSRRRDDDYDDYDSRVSRSDRDRRRDDRPPPEVKVGKYDIGPWIEKGKKHWITLAPILTPIVMNMARKHMGGGSSGGGKGGRR